MRPFLYDASVKKFSLPKIHFPVKKKKIDGPLWEISTKIPEAPSSSLTKSRKNKQPWTDYIRRGLLWFQQYFRTVWWVFFAGCISLVFFALFATPLFKLNPDKINIVLRPEPVFDRNAIHSILSDFAGRNIFSISTREIFQSLSENIRHIASVEKTLVFPDGLRITITSFSPSYRAYIGEEIFLLTENGQLIADIPEVDAPAIQVHHLISDPNLGKSTPIMIEDMKIIRNILQFWRRNLVEYPINALKFYDQEKEIHIVNNNTTFIISLNSGAKNLQSLIALIQKGEMDTRRYLYLDLRVPGRIYTCAREEGECARNMTRIYEA
jgi:cell division septal protein FtsQ